MKMHYHLSTIAVAFVLAAFAGHAYGQNTQVDRWIEPFC